MPNPRLAPSPGSNALTIALTFAVAVTAFTLLGLWADRRLATSPLFLIVGALLGTVGGMLHAIARLAPEALRRRRPPDQRDQPRT